MALPNIRQIEPEHQRDVCEPCSLIAGISLLDAVSIAGTGAGVAGLSVLGFVLTLVLQRFVAGT